MKKKWNFGVIFGILASVSFVCLLFSGIYLGIIKHLAHGWQWAISTFLVYIAFMGSGADGFNKYKFYKKTAYFYAISGFFIALTSVCVFISPNNYLVLVQTDGYQIYRGNINFINPVEVDKSENVRLVPKGLEENKFYELETNSYDFIKFRVVSKLRASDDYQIYKASRDSYPGVSSKVKEYLIKILKTGERDKTTIAEKALKLARDNIQGYWLPEKIEIISLNKVDS